MWDFEHSVEAPVSRERVWAVWTDIESWPSWNPGVVRVELNGPLAEGATGSVRAAGGPASKLRVLDGRPRATLRDRGVRAAHAPPFRARARRLAGRSAAHQASRADDGPRDAAHATHDRALGSSARSPSPSQIWWSSQEAGPQTDAAFPPGRCRSFCRCHRHFLRHPSYDTSATTSPSARIECSVIGSRTRITSSAPASASSRRPAAIGPPSPEWRHRRRRGRGRRPRRPPQPARMRCAPPRSGRAPPRRRRP